MVEEQVAKEVEVDGAMHDDVYGKTCDPFAPCSEPFLLLCVGFWLLALGCAVLRQSSLLAVAVKEEERKNE